MGLTLPQPPRHDFPRGTGRKHNDTDEPIKKLYEHVHNLHRALKSQLDKIVGEGGGGGTDTGGSVTEQLGLTVKPQILAQCYDVTARFDIHGYSTDRNGLLEYFNPGNAGVAYQETLSLDNIDLPVMPFVVPQKFSVEFRGIYHAGTGGLHFFGLDCDGVAELLIDGAIVCSRYASGTYAGNLSAVSGNATLIAGYHNLIIRWLTVVPGRIQASVQTPLDSAPVIIPAADLGHYSGGLEAGAPTNLPVPQPPTTVGTGGTSFITTLPWTYIQPPSGSGSEKQADGFILYFEEGVTGTPTKNQVKLAVTALAYNFTWPKNRQTSYAIATYRKTENGEEVGPPQTIAQWQGVVSTAPILIADPATNPDAPSDTIDIGHPSGVATGGDLNVHAGGAVTITGATVTIAAAGQILISGGKIRVESAQPIEVKSVLASSPAEIRFLDVSNTVIGRLSGVVTGGVSYVRLNPNADNVYSLQIGLPVGERWADISLNAGGAIALNGSTVGLGGGPTFGRTVTGDVTEVTSASAIVDLLQQLATMGIIVNSTSSSPGTVSGSRSNAGGAIGALDQLIGVLAAAGFINDSTSP